MIAALGCSILAHGADDAPKPSPKAREHPEKKERNVHLPPRPIAARPKLSPQLLKRRNVGAPIARSLPNKIAPQRKTPTASNRPPLIAARHTGPNPPLVGGNTTLPSRNVGELDGRQIHRRP
jgi:hypothetical protein